MGLKLKYGVDVEHECLSDLSYSKQWFVGGLQWTCAVVFKGLETTDQKIVIQWNINADINGYRIIHYIIVLIYSFIYMYIYIHMWLIEAKTDCRFAEIYTGSLIWFWGFKWRQSKDFWGTHERCIGCPTPTVTSKINNPLEI